MPSRFLCTDMLLPPSLRDKYRQRPIRFSDQLRSTEEGFFVCSWEKAHHNVHTRLNPRSVCIAPCLDCIRYMRLLTPHWTRCVEKGANNHEDETKEYEPEPCSKMRWATKATQDGPYVPHQTLNYQPCESGSPSPGHRSRRKFSKKAGCTRPYNEKCR